MENGTSSSQKQIIAGVVYSTFEREGPIPKICFPKTMPEEKQLTIAMKSISLLMGESVYQEGNELESIKYFGILPYPDLNLTGLTYFFLIQDANARGKAMAATICLLIDEKFSSFIYENMKDLSVFFVDAAQSITSETDYLESKEIIQTFKDKIENYIAELQTPITTDHQIKILFTGLDASGKTSFLRAIKQKYSELTGITPTKGISRTNEILLGQRLMEWDCGGQLKYRRNFLKHAELYLFETNLMHFLIDTRDEERFDDALSFFKDIIKIFKEFKQYP
ncbi:MAG: ADP-ribosylation factor-like protein, partial [Promethearchaeota archaeon]